MTGLPAPRAAALRGDDYQHIIGLYYALEVITDADLAAVSVEDAAGGAFDDVVVWPAAMSGAPTRYIQVKAGMYNNVVIEGDWLTATRTARGKSPLQHFHKTWRDRVADGRPFTLEMCSNKNYEHNDPIIQLIDHGSRTIPRARLDRLAPGSRAARQLSEWAEHLDIEIDELTDFLTAVAFRHGEEEDSWVRRCGTLMRLANLRGDTQAVTLAHAMVRGWVKTGAGRRSADEILDELAGLGLLARDEQVLLVIHAVDAVKTRHRPNAEVDIVDLYEGTTPFERRALRDPTEWDTAVIPALEAAKDTLLCYESRRVRVVAAMRLPMYFAVGRTFPRVGNWVLTTDQRGVAWSTDTETANAALEVTGDQVVGAMPDLAVVVELSVGAADDVVAYLARAAVPVGRMVTLSVPGGPAQDSVPGPAWAATWARLAREQIRAVARELRPARIHLFMAAPAGVAMFLGHEWNLMPITTVYEHLGFEGYAPAMTFRG